MSHLDAEFKKQAVPEVKCLITDQVSPICNAWKDYSSYCEQFQGKQIYGTMCNHCQYRSERVSDFLEIEINFTVSAVDLHTLQLQIWCFYRITQG